MLCRSATNRAALVIAGVIATAPAAATLIVVDFAVFTITSDAGDAVTVNCDGGFVRVVDDGVPTTYETVCAGVTFLTVTGGPLDNTIDLSGVTAATFTAIPAVTIDGAGGIDTITGSQLSDSIPCGSGNDVIDGGSGSDTFSWVPGHGSDTITGGGGTDTLIFTGTNSNEIFSVVVEGTGFDLMRSIGNFTLDVDAVETLNVQMLGGDDNYVTVPLEAVSQLVDGGTHTNGDFLLLGYEGSCGGRFATIVAQNFESMTSQQSFCTGADIDDNGVVEPLTDGLLLLRYAFGFRGATLVTGAVAADCVRCEAAAVEAYIQGMY